MTEDRERKIASLESALNKALKRCGDAQGRAANGAEAEYGQIYQALVRLGVRPQIKKKYRV